MDLVREVCSLGRNARETAEIKVRQPIKTLILPYGNKAIIGDLLPIIKEELNVKEVEFVKDMDKYLEYSVKPNFKEVGKILGPRVSLFKEYLENISKEDIEKLKEGELHISLGGDSYTITPSMVLIDLKEKEGFASKTSNMTSVVLDTNLTDDLILEGLAREFVRTVQALRKEKDLVITDHIIFIMMVIRILIGCFQSLIHMLRVKLLQMILFLKRLLKNMNLMDINAVLILKKYKFYI